MRAILIWSAICVFGVATIPALTAQSFTYQISVPAVTTGPLQTAAIQLQFSSAKILDLPVPPASPLHLQQQSNFALSGAPQPGYAFNDAILAGGPNTLVGISFQNSAGLTIAYTLTAGPLTSVGSFPLRGAATLTPAGGGVTVNGDAVNTSITIAATTAPPPTLIASPPGLTFFYAQGGPFPGPQAFSILSSGAPLGFSIATGGEPWISVAPLNGTTPAILQASVNPAGLAAGTYSSVLHLSTPGTSVTSSVSVSLTIVSPTQPPPTLFQVVNSASYAPLGAPNAGIAQGSLFVVFGFALGPTTLIQSDYPLSTNLSGTSVKVTVGGVSTNALLLYTLTTQLAAILPSATPTGSGFLEVTYKGQTGPPVPIVVVPSAFGTYTVSSNGLGSGIVTGADYVLKTASHPAKPGDVLILWGTGLGGISTDESLRPPVENRFSPQVFVGNLQAKVQYAGRSNCCSGLDQINFEVPAGIEGCLVPIVVKTGSIVGNFSTIPVSSNSTCSDSVGFAPDLVSRAAAGTNLNLGVVAIGPVPILQFLGFPISEAAAHGLSVLLGKSVAPGDLRKLLRAEPSQRRSVAIELLRKYGVHSRSDVRRVQNEIRATLGEDSQGVVASFQSLSNLAAIAPQLMSDFPSSGTCIAFQRTPSAGAGAGAISRGLDASATLSISSPEGTKTLSKFKEGDYQALLGSALTPFQAPLGSYRISGTGGRDVGAFSASLNFTSSLQWSNKSVIGTVDRSQPLSINFSGGPATGHVIFGGFADGQGGAAFVCVDDIRKGTITVPAHVLSVLPATGPHRGYLFLTLHPFETTFSAPGLDTGFFANFSTDSRDVQFR
jgi:uncharacterized protein (TIGR03437 family)